MWRSICILVVLGLAFASEIDLENYQDELQNTLSEHGLGEINQTEVIEKAKKLLMTKCEKSGGGNTAYEAIVEALPNLKDCIQERLNASTIEDELNEAKKTGSMDDVFGKYCNRTPVAMKCITDFNTKMEPCLEPEEKTGLNNFINITESFTNFLCSKDGDKMAMFIAEGGQECIESQNENIQKCLNQSLSHRMTDLNKVVEDLTGDNVTIPLLVFKPEYCQDFDNFHQCAVEELERCENNTPANLIDALLKYIRRSIPCKEAARARANSRVGNSSSMLASSSLAITLLSFLAILRA